MAGDFGSPGAKRADGSGVLRARGSEGGQPLRLARRLRKKAAGKSASPEISNRARAEKTSEEFIDLAIGSDRGRFEVRLDLGGGVLLQLVRS